MRAVLLVVALGACGRLAFDPIAPGGVGNDGGGDGDASDAVAQPTRPMPCVLTSDMGLAVLALTVDDAANAYVMLVLSGGITLGSQTFTNSGAGDFVVVSLDPSCSVRWARQLVITNTAGFSVVGRKTLVADGAGGVFVGSDFIGAIDPGNGMHNAAGGTADEDLFAAHIDASGALAWFQALGTNAGEIAGGLARAPDGGVVMGGEFSTTINLGAGNVTSAGMGDILLIGYSSTGTVRPGQRFGGAASDYVARLASNDAGTIYGAGSFSGGSTNIGTGTLMNKGSTDAFFVAYSSSFAPQASAAWGTTGFESATAIAATAGGAALAGTFDTAIDFGTGTNTPVGSSDVFVVGVTASGATRWARGFGSSSGENIDTIAATSAGADVVATSFAGSVDFGMGPLAAGSYVVGLADTDGSTRWVASVGGSVGYVAPLGSSGIVAAGTFVGSVTLGGTMFSSSTAAAYVVQVH